MKSGYPSLLTCAVVTALLSGPSRTCAQPTMGTAESFAVLSGGTIENTNATAIVGHVGVGTGSAINGLVPGNVTHGDLHFGDSAALQALNDIQIVHDGQIGPCGTELTGQDLGGRTLLPGSYCSVSSAELTGTLVLDAAGDPNAVFVLFIVGRLQTADHSMVVMGGGGKLCNVTWVVGSTATLGSESQFLGNLIGLENVSLGAGAGVTGRVLARYGTVTMDANTISIPECSTTATVAVTWGRIKQIYRN